MIERVPFRSPVHRPRMFALTRDADDPTQIIGYGIELPDGSAYSVSWPAERGCSFSSCDSAEQTAMRRGADLLWIATQPRPNDPAAPQLRGHAMFPTTETKMQPASDPIALVGIAEITDVLLRITLGGVQHLTYRRDFPEPLA
jgi:hypothetical protein